MRPAISHGLVWWLGHLASPLTKTFLTLGSNLSLPSLCSALIIAVGFLVLRRSDRSKLKIRVLRRALFPRRLFTSASSRADLGFLFLNMFVTAGVIGWAVLSGTVVADAVRHALGSILGERAPNRLDPGVWHLVSTVVVFLVYDFAYWINHYASHRVGWLWEFHKVHHTAEVLTPITNARVHPIDSLVFANFLAIFLGVANGVLAYCFGKVGTPLSIGGNNALVIVFAFTFQHLQHSHIWIATTGRLGRVIFSPAHHQIHHSDARVHFDKNFGSCLAVWDWMFGTLYAPSSRRERLTYGCSSAGVNPHTAIGSLLMPFLHAAARVLQALQQRALLPGFQIRH